MVGRLTLLGTLTMVVALAGCTSASTPRPVVSTPRPVVSTPLPMPSAPVAAATGDGTVTGGLYRCFGVPPSMPARPIAGTIAVFWGPLPGLPGWIIKTDGEYTIQLPPGLYDLVGHWTGSNLAPPMAKVVVSSGKTTHQDLVYSGCI